MADLVSGSQLCEITDDRVDVSDICGWHVRCVTEHSTIHPVSLVTRADTTPSLIHFSKSTSFDQIRQPKGDKIYSINSVSITESVSNKIWRNDWRPTMNKLMVWTHIYHQRSFWTCFLWCKIVSLKCWLKAKQFSWWNLTLAIKAKDFSNTLKRQNVTYA